MRKIIAVLSDMHAGHSLGLCNPEAMIFDTAPEPAEEIPVSINSWQQYLWEEIFLTGIDGIKNIAGDDEVHLVSLGDVTQGSKYPSHLTATSDGNQCRIAASNLAVITKELSVKRVTMVVGTSAHVGEEFGLTHATASILKNEHETQLEHIDVSQHAVLDVHGYQIDLAHHGSSGGGRQWLRGNIVRYEAISQILEYIENGETPPDMFLRGHFHDEILETITRKINGDIKEFKYVIIPSMTGMNAYARKVTRSRPTVTNGMVAIEVVDGNLSNIHFLSQTKNLRTTFRI